MLGVTAPVLMAQNEKADYTVSNTCVKQLSIISNFSVRVFQTGRGVFEFPIDLPSTNEKINGKDTQVENISVRRLRNGGHSACIGRELALLYNVKY